MESSQFNVDMMVILVVSTTLVMLSKLVEYYMSTDTYTMTLYNDRLCHKHTRLGLNASVA